MVERKIWIVKVDDLFYNLFIYSFCSQLLNWLSLNYSSAEQKTLSKILDSPLSWCSIIPYKGVIYPRCMLKFVQIITSQTMKQSTKYKYSANMVGVIFCNKLCAIKDINLWYACCLWSCGFICCLFVFQWYKLYAWSYKIGSTNFT